MSFMHPWILVFWLVPVFLLLWEAFREGPRVSIPIDHRKHSKRFWLGKVLWTSSSLPHFLLLVGIAVVAGPQFMGEPEKKREISNIEICLDVSGSMGVSMSDGKLRSDAAVESIQYFCKMREGDACGLTIFGGETIRWTPLTRDLAAISLAAPFIDPQRLPPHMNSTRIGLALESCLATLSKVDEGDRLIVLLSDGFSSDLGGGASRQIGQELSKYNVALYAIFIGDGAAPGQLYEVVSQTEGEVFAVSDSAGLERVFNHIDEMKPARLKPAGSRPIEDFSIFAWSGLGLLGLHLLLFLRWRITPW
ncbi:MAG: VWA domain-containing protein [Planctomycetia bacterium]|nr:VWA domain-containing protein [Planctomycetia bacterium]NCG55454.1 VWA domain-containing protein [Pseudomonadota bacterium]